MRRVHFISYKKIIEIADALLIAAYYDPDWK
jgi:hypothetical protein